MREERENRINELYLLLDYPELSLTAEEICDETGWTRAQFGQAVQDLRHALGDSDSIRTVLCEPNGFRQPWLYSLRDGAISIDENESGWLPFNMDYIETRLTTTLAVVKTGVRQKDGRTAEGKLLRRLMTDLTRSLEDVAEAKEWVTAS